MITLAIETTAGVCSVALLKKNEILQEIHLETSSQQQTLMPNIKRLYTETKISKTSTSLIAVDIGPGAFTALRIGVSTAKALAHALNIPIIGINAIDALYEQSVIMKPGNFTRIAMIDARRKKVFAGVYKSETDSVKELDLKPADILYYIDEKSPLLFFGSGAMQYKEDIQNLCKGRKFCILEENASVLRAGFIGKLAYRNFKNGRKDDLHAIVPFYVRDTDTTTKGK